MRCYGWIPHLSDGLDTIFPEVSQTGYTVLNRFSNSFGGYSGGTLTDALKVHGSEADVSLTIKGGFYGTRHSFKVSVGGRECSAGVTVSRDGMMLIEPEDMPEHLERNLCKTVYHFMKQKLHDETHHAMIDYADPSGMEGYIEVPRPVFCDDRDTAVGMIARDLLRLCHNSLMQVCGTVPVLVKLSRLEDLLFRHGLGRSFTETEVSEIVSISVETGLVRSADELCGLSKKALLSLLHARLEENIDRQNRLISTLYESSKGSICYARNFGRIFGDLAGEGFQELLENDAEALDVLYNVHRNNEDYRLAKINERMNEIGMRNGDISRTLTYVIVFFTVTSALVGFAAILFGL